MDFIESDLFPRNNLGKIDRTLNRHRWASRVDSGAWENYVEGTRQNDSVTSGERVLYKIFILKSDTKSGVATV